MMQSGSSDVCARIYSVDVLNPFEPELQLINAKPVIKNKLKDLIGE